MDPHVGGDPAPPTLAELTTRWARDENGDISLELNVEFTSQRTGSLPLLALGEEFDVDIQHQIVYPVNDAPEDDAEYDAPEEQEEHSPEPTRQDGEPIDAEDSYKVHNSSNSQDEPTPRRLYKRGMGLSPSPSPLRLFPPSPSSVASREEPDDYTDENKENTKPPVANRQDIASPGSHAHAHPTARNTTMIHIPSSPLESRSTGIGNLEMFATSSPPSAVRVEKRKFRSEIPRRSPDKGLHRVTTISSTGTVNPFLPPGKPKRLSLLPVKAKEGGSQWSVEQSRRDSEPSRVRRRTFSPERSNGGVQLEPEDTKLATISSDASEDETEALSTPRWLHTRREKEEPHNSSEDSVKYDSAPDFNSPTTGYAADTETDDGRGVDSILSLYRSRSLESMNLPSPSPSSQCSMPWNSAEELACRERTNHGSVTTRQPLALPVLEYSHGVLSLTFHEGVPEGAYICEAGVRIRDSAASNSAQRKDINIIHPAALLNSPLTIMRAVQSPQACLAIPRVCRGNSVMDFMPRGMPFNADNEGDKAKEGNTDSEPSHHVHREQIGIPFVGVLLTWLQSQLSLISEIAATIAMSIRSSMIEEDGLLHNLVFYLVLLSFPPLIVKAMNDSCRAWDLRQPVAYYPGQASTEAICTTWIRGRDSVKDWVEEFRSEVFGRKHRGEWATASAWMDAAAAGERPVRYTNQRNPREEQVRDSVFPRYVITEEGQYVMMQGQYLIVDEADDSLLLEDKASEVAKPTEESDEVSQDIEHADEEQPEEQVQAGEEKPLSLRDRIDLLLGWRGPPSWRYA